MADLPAAFLERCGALTDLAYDSSLRPDFGAESFDGLPRLGAEFSHLGTKSPHVGAHTFDGFPHLGAETSDGFPRLGAESFDGLPHLGAEPFDGFPHLRAEPSDLSVLRIKSRRQSVKASVQRLNEQLGDADKHHHN